MQNQEYEIRELVQKIERVLSYIENDSSTGRKGLFAQVDENKVSIEQLQRDAQIRKGLGVGLGMAGAAIFFLIKIIIELLSS